MFSHLFLSPPQMEQSPLGSRPPQDPESGFLLKITPIDMAVIAMHKMTMLNNISII